MLPEGYVQSEAMRLEIYGRAARCRSDDDLEDLEEETSRRFGRLPPEARDFFAAAQAPDRLQAAWHRQARCRAWRPSLPLFLPGRLRKSRARSLQRDGDRVVYPNKNGTEGPLARVEEFLDLLDE